MKTATKAKSALDSYHWHEALDRAFLAMEWFNEYVEEHPAVRRTPTLRKTARELSDGLWGFYQAVANADPNNHPHHSNGKMKTAKRS